MKDLNGRRMFVGFIFILLNYSERHRILITHNPPERLLSQAFRLNGIKFHCVILL